MSSRRVGPSGISRISRAEGVRRQLEHAIRTGAFRPGERLPSERELVERFGVSRLSVREGIQGLIGMGLVEARHGSGYFVVERPGDGYRNAFASWLAVHSDELIDMYEIRGALTTLAARRAIRRGEAALEPILASHRAFIDAVERDAPSGEIADLDVRFHRAIAEASGSRLVNSLLTDLYERLEEPRHAVMEIPGQRERSAREHEAIVDALQARDEAAIARAVGDHIDSVCRTIREQTFNAAASPS